MNNISELVNEASVHSAVYTDAAIFQWEMREIFGNSWVFVGHASEIPSTGDLVRRTIGLEEVLMVRDKSGGVSVLVNRCTHRGNLMCNERKASKRTITCQFHGWAFGLDGSLLAVPAPDGAPLDKDSLALKKAKVGIYRGFVFATFAEDPPTLQEYLGRAAAILDQACDLSPEGELNLIGGWVQHSFHANWKMLIENDTDGYHANTVHSSFVKGVALQGKYKHVLIDEKKLEPIARDLGKGHVDLDYSPAYKKPMIWLGTEPDRYPEYNRLMEQKYGESRALEIRRLGPPHAFIFPNLFLAEGVVTMIQPVDAGSCVNWSTPLYLKGAPSEVNTRIKRQGEAAVGPAAFLLADDATILERTYSALVSSPAWLSISRGLQREHRMPDGVITSHFTDETPNRGFWRHYKTFTSRQGAMASQQE